MVCIAGCSLNAYLIAIENVHTTAAVLQAAQIHFLQMGLVRDVDRKRIPGDRAYARRAEALVHDMVFGAVDPNPAVHGFQVRDGHARVAIVDLQGTCDDEGIANMFRHVFSSSTDHWNFTTCFCETSLSLLTRIRRVVDGFHVGAEAAGAERVDIRRGRGRRGVLGGLRSLLRGWGLDRDKNQKSVVLTHRIRKGANDAKKEHENTQPHICTAISAMSSPHLMQFCVDMFCVRSAGGAQPLQNK